MCAVLSLLALAFTVISFQTSWFNFEFSKNCDHEVFIVLYVRTGICYTDAAIGYTKHECVRWGETQTWQNIDEISGTRTEHAAEVSFPQAGAILITLIGSSSLQALICIFSWKFVDSPFGNLRQFFVTVLSLWFVAGSYAAGYLSSTTDVTKDSTWKPLIQCTNIESYPASAQLALAMGLLLSVVMVTITILPSKFWCFQFVSAEEGSLIERGTISRSLRAHSGDVLLVDRTLSMSSHNSPLCHENIVVETISVASPVEYEDVKKGARLSSMTDA